MNYTDPDPLPLDETQWAAFAALYQQQQHLQPGQHSFPRAASRHLAASDPPFGPSNVASQYGVIPHNYGVNAHTNFLSNSPSAPQPAFYAFDRWATTTGPYASVNIVQPPLSDASAEQFDHQSYGPRTNYAQSYNDDFVAQQHSASPSINLSHNAYTPFRDSDLGTAGGLEQDTSMTGFGTPTSSNVAFPFPLVPVAQQCPQSFNHQPSPPQESNSFLQVPSPLTPSPFRCSHCGHDSRTQSEHKKHMARHEKPHKCPDPSCDYASATANDLERHARSKHFSSSLDGQPAKAHVCSLEPCKSQDRKFSRLDNFRNHLRKRHNLSEEVVEQLVRSSRQSVQSVYSRGRRGSVSFRGHESTPENGIAWPYSDTNTQESTRHAGGIMYRYPQRTVSYPPQVLEVDGAIDPLCAGQYAPQNESAVNRTAAENAVMGQSRFRQSLPLLQIPATPSNFSHQADTPMTSRYGSEAGSPYSMGDIEHHRLALESAGYEVTLRSQPGTPSEVPSRRASKRPPRPQHPDHYDATCCRCRLLKDRPSELRKHIDRKQGMFFCTSGCDATFGGKDEWRRHENCTHWGFEKWSCTLAEPSGSACKYESYHGHQFKTHLTTNHPAFVNEHGHDSQHFKVFDEGFPTTFWCGFCTYCLEMIGDADQRFRGRLNHIEDHLKGRNMWPRGTAETWVREPEGGCHTTKPLDCRLQAKTPRPARHRSKSAPDAANMQQPANNMALGIPSISFTPDQEQAGAIPPPQRPEPTLQTASTRSRSSSSPNPQRRPRRRTTTRTCVSPPPSSPAYSYVDDLSSINFEEWVADDWDDL